MICNGDDPCKTSRKVHYPGSKQQLSDRKFDPLSRRDVFGTRNQINYPGFIESRNLEGEPPTTDLGDQQCKLAFLSR